MIINRNVKGGSSISPIQRINNGQCNCCGKQYDNYIGTGTANPRGNIVNIGATAGIYVVVGIQGTDTGAYNDIDFDLCFESDDQWVTIRNATGDDVKISPDYIQVGTLKRTTYANLQPYVWGAKDVKNWHHVKLRFNGGQGSGTLELWIDDLYVLSVSNFTRKIPSNPSYSFVMEATDGVYIDNFDWLYTKNGANITYSCDFTDSPYDAGEGRVCYHGVNNGQIYFSLWGINDTTIPVSQAQTDDRTLVKYHLNGGTTDILYIPTVIDGETTLRFYPPTKSGNIFKGWSENQNSQTAEYNENNNWVYKKLTPSIVYAVWQEI